MVTMMYILHRESHTMGKLIPYDSTAAPSRVRVPTPPVGIT